MPSAISSRRDFNTDGYGFNRDHLPPTHPTPPPTPTLSEAKRLAASDLKALFHLSPDPARPLDLEIGSGKGTFLVQQAPLEPGIDFLGVEYAFPFWRYAADRLRRHALPNARILWHDAVDFVKTHCGDGVFRQVHIYFPDPWPKARHHKRRTVQQPFLRELHRVLMTPTRPGEGEIRLATDHADYFAWMQEHAGLVADLFEQRPFDTPGSAGAGELVGTNFERKYRKEGRAFHGLVLVKRR